MKASFKGTLIKSATVADIRTVVEDWEVMLVTILDALLQRYQRDPQYHFIDTKLSMLNGKDFPTLADPATDFKGKTAICGWIQGRGLEALVGHVRWLPQCAVLSSAEKSDRIRRLTKMVGEVFDQMEKIRARNGGRIWFLHTPDGVPLDMDEQGRRRPFDIKGTRPTGGDLFYVKGMLAAAHLLNRPEKIQEAIAYFHEVLNPPGSLRSVKDRFSFDPKNKVEPVPGRHGHSMVALGGIALFAQLVGTEEWLEAGQRFIRNLLDHHVNTGQFPDLQLYDFTEYLDDDNQPWRYNNQVLCDPGHALEFIGLAGKLLLLLREQPAKSSAQQAFLDQCNAVFPKIYLKNLANGFNRKVGGICKSFDLISRTPINSDMPWWNLPETLRAAAELLLLCPDDPAAPAIRQSIVDCSNAFFGNFVNRNVHLMAYQTIDVTGKPVDVIPATPDADPAYHTGLSIIDFLRCLESWAGA